MADIFQINLPDGNTYNIKDTTKTASTGTTQGMWYKIAEGSFPDNGERLSLLFAVSSGTDNVYSGIYNFTARTVDNVRYINLLVYLRDQILYTYDAQAVYDNDTWAIYQYIRTGYTKSITWTIISENIDTSANPPYTLYNNATPEASIPSSYTYQTPPGIGGQVGGVYQQNNDDNVDRPILLGNDNYYVFKNSNISVNPYTGNLQTTQINGTTVGSSPKFTDSRVAQIATSTDSEYEVLFSGTADNATRIEGTRKSESLIFNPETGALTIKNEDAASALTVFGPYTSLRPAFTITPDDEGGVSAHLFKSDMPAVFITAHNHTADPNDSEDEDRIGGEISLNGTSSFSTINLDGQTSTITVSNPSNATPTIILDGANGGISATSLNGATIGNPPRWEGTQAQYDALATYDPNTIYYITDGIPGGITVINDLSDVSISSPQNGQSLIYDSSAQKWTNVGTSTACSVTAGPNMPSGFPVPTVTRRGNLVQVVFGFQLPARTYENTDVLWYINPVPISIARVQVAFGGSFPTMNFSADGGVKFNGSQQTVSSATWLIGQAVYLTDGVYINY